MYTYPVTITRLENGQYMAEFPDVPQALTYGASEALALEWAQDALHEALDQYMDLRLDIPTPRHTAEGKPNVSVAPMVGIKLTIYQAMREQGITQERLASLLTCDAKQVRRLLDIFHNSTLEQMTTALAVLGYRLEMHTESIRHNAPEYTYA